MGDNIYLGDRNGVRTPMQWTGDRNAGFSRADPAALYAPIIMDPVYGYQAINVEAQERSPFSLLQWMKRMISLRRQHKTFGRGSIRFLHPANRKILAFVREGAGERILVVANLARTVQPVELDLGGFENLTPVEMLGHTEFPRVGTTPYFLVLGPYAFYWFLLEEQPSPVTARVAPAAAEDAPVAPALLAGGAWETLLDGGVRHLVERECLPPYLRRQRWFAGKGRDLRAAAVLDWVLLRRGREPAFLTIIEVQFADEGRELYLLTMALESGEAADTVLANSPETVLARLTGARKGVLYDACTGEAVGRELLSLMASAQPLATRAGEMKGRTTRALEQLRQSVDLEGLRASLIKAEQSNSSLIFGDRLILKLIRRLEPGPNPDVEVGLHLGARPDAARVPLLHGALEYQRPGSEPFTLAVLHQLVPHQANGWQHAIEELGRYFERVAERPPAAAGAGGLPCGGEWAGTGWPEPPREIFDAIGGYLQSAARLGQRTGELHLALADDRQNPAFRPDAFTTRDLAIDAARMADEARVTLDYLEQRLGALPDADRAEAERLLADRTRVTAMLSSMTAVPEPGARIRVHGDYHLGQVLWAEQDFYILDFEGEPDRTLVERRAKQSPVKDVAGMVRSFGYAAQVALRSTAPARPANAESAAAWAASWQRWVAGAFLRAYLEAAGGGTFLPGDRASFDALLRVFSLEKALYELRYEINHRPDWVSIPLRGILDVLDGETRR